MLIEPFAGGGIIGLTAAFERLAEHVLLIEKDENVSAVWRSILSGQAQWLADEIRAFKLTEKNVKRILESDINSQRLRAFATIVRNRVQRGGILAAGAGLVKGGENGKGLGSRWYPETLASRIEAIAELRQHITFVEGDGLETIRRYADDESIAFFCRSTFILVQRLQLIFLLSERGFEQW